MECRVCSSGKTNLLFFAKNIHGRKFLSPEQFAIYGCDSCNVAFTEVKINGGYYTRYYPEDYYSNRESHRIVAIASETLQKISFSRKIRLIMRYKPKGNRILEIGCGKGDFLYNLPAYFEKYGVEINERGYRYIKENYKDITVYNAEVDSDYFPARDTKFDIIVMWHVFEHIANPRTFIKALANLLAEGGVIIFDIPNRNSLGFNLAKKSWFHLDTPRHLFYFNFKSIKQLLSKYDLKVIKYFSVKIDYFHDLSASFYEMLKTRNILLNIFIIAVVVPFGLLIRLIFALVCPELAEVNTYVVSRTLQD